MPGKQMKSPKGGAHPPSAGTKGPKEGHPMTPTNQATDKKSEMAGPMIAGQLSKPANSANLYQEGNMSLSSPDPRHRPDSAVSNMLPGGTTQSGETGGM